MKKLVLSAAIIFGSLSIYATTTKVGPVQTIVKFQSEYKEIKAEEVPGVVTKALEAAYPGAKLEKASVNEKKEYKLDIAVGDQKATVYSDANGNWLKI
ncbi:hypothetical protein DMB65_14200 [Flavobacterium cheongpyeongense]|jgi:hypothetical protein|uniref:Beta-lactamase-inhibitor-like PepSY-like domain-containing protein n=1 Tax=Flavobacterium cheongpyeongense TaxID=2212651 RepID=A0A2V4BNV6_9FLAO|nr:hypothetical protein [Flavobacterium cheongpyeongense]PXY40212.1 hypothetical protein DMB65_14200 [Flavobacterium cheongpyeongense]